MVSCSVRSSTAPFGMVRAHLGPFYGAPVCDQWRPDPASATWEYVQLADHVADMIAAGRYAPGERLPSQRAMARTHGVALDTVSRALTLLRSRGLVHTTYGRGTYVRDRADDT